MKYLLYYKLDNEFISDQVSVGGDGTKVVSVVDGVAWSNDQEKVYYRLANNDSENLTSYTVTVHYKSGSNKTLAPDDVYVVDAYIGKGVKETVTAKGISGYTALNDSKELIINDNAEYTFFYKAIPDYKKPLTFNIISDGTIRWKTESSSNRKHIQYRINEGEWYDITSNTGASAPSISVSAGDVLQFKGDNATYAYGTSYYNRFVGTAKFEVEGNIMSLIDSQNFATATTLETSYTFCRLFYDCSGLTSAENLVLPATTLVSQCYSYMFQGCTSLTTAPELPATTLVSQCYSYMFNGCTSLTTASELPATTLANYCYTYMFQGCTSLTTAPALPATTLADSCYYGMFSGCTNLNYIKCLATDISASNCTTNWTMGVSSTGTFVKNPNMSSWTTGANGIPTNWTVVEKGISVSVKNVVISKSGGSETFTILSTEGNWTTTTSDNWIVLSQLTGNTGETNVTITLGSTVNKRSGSITFTDGINVSILPVNQIDYADNYLTFKAKENGTFKFSGSTTANTLQYSLDNGTTWNNLTDNTNTPTVNSGSSIMFKGNCVPSSGGIGKFISSGLFDVEGNVMSLIYGDNFGGQTTLSSAYTFYNLFQSCTRLTSAENLSLPATTLASYCYQYMFYYCTSLVNAPELPATTLANNCYQYMFGECTSLTSAPALPATTLANQCYSRMFNYCTSLVNAPELPATTLTESCYGSMFNECTSLTSAPELPATTLANYCYEAMFRGCTSLNAITCLATDISATECTTFWVYNVSPTGVFTKAEGMTGWTTDINGIPQGWTVQDNV